VVRFLLLLVVAAAFLAPGAAAQDVCPSQVDPRERCDDAASACVATSGFESVSVRAQGRGLRLGFKRARARRVTVDVFQHSAGHRVLGNRRVAHFTGRRKAVVWRGRRGGAGLYSARFTMKLPGGLRDVRRVALVRRGGTFSKRPAFYRRASCGALSSYKLERPAFGARGLGIAFRLGAPARVTVVVRRAGKTVRTFKARSGVPERTYRLRFRVRRRGDYVVRLSARPASGRVVRARLTARRL
jgi:hypothetical protein